MRLKSESKHGKAPDIQSDSGETCQFKSRRRSQFLLIKVGRQKPFPPDDNYLIVEDD